MSGFKRSSCMIRRFIGRSAFQLREDLMKPAKTLPFTLILVLAAAGCSTTSAPRAGGNVYNSSESNRAMYSAGCVVRSARYVAVVGDGAGDMRRNAVNTGIGAVAGGLIGRAIGDEIGGGSGRDLAKNLGTIGGAVVGANVAEGVNARRTTREGVEYRVGLDGRSDRVVVQELAEGERPLPAGSACNLVGTNGRVRVLPG